MHKNELDTPVLIGDLDIINNNIMKMTKIAADANLNLRPHTKTHKIPEIAKMQIKAGAKGITCAKLGEAEIMINAGITDVLIAYPILGHRKIQRLMKLHKKASILVSLDNYEVAFALSNAFSCCKKKLEVLVEVEIGLNRLGVKPGEALVDFIKTFLKLPGLKFKGLLSHSGHVHNSKNPNEIATIAKNEGELMVKEANHLRSLGIPVDIISIGSTPGAKYNAKSAGITEIRPGTYVFNDVNCIDLFCAEPKNCAVRVISTVVSTPNEDHIVLDCGSKSLGGERAKNGGFGLLYEYPEIRITKLYEEHAVINFDPAKYQFKIGNRLEVIPAHVCNTINLWNNLVGIRNNDVELVWRIAGRGKVS